LKWSDLQTNTTEQKLNLRQSVNNDFLQTKQKGKLLLKHEHQSHSYRISKSKIRTKRHKRKIEAIAKKPAGRKRVVLMKKRRQGNQSGARQQSTKKETKNVTRNGLVNIGNTCYLNATVQMIISSRSVTSFLRDITFDTQEPKNELYVLKYLESKIRSSKSAAVTLKKPHHQIIAPAFPIGEQNDPKDFLSLLMNSLSNINVRTNGNITDNFFTGSNQDTRVCSQCNVTQAVPSVTFNLCCELELIQTHMIQKPMLRVEVCTRALRASQNVKKRCVPCVANRSQQPES